MTDKNPTSTMNPFNLKYGPTRKAPTFYAGEGLTRKDVERHYNGAAYGIRNKFARRVIRGRCSRGTMKVKVAAAHRHMAALRRMADNVHEYKRVAAEDFAERRGTK